MRVTADEAKGKLCPMIQRKVAYAAMMFMCAVAGCAEPGAREVAAPVSVPAELRDCKVYSYKGDDTPTLYIVRCPNSTTSAEYETGGKTKTRHHTITIDGKKYQQVD